MLERLLPFLQSRRLGKRLLASLPLSHPPANAQAGFTAIEFTLAAIPILLLSLGAYEVSAWYNTRHILNLALLEAARQGAVQHAHPQSIQDAFEQAINPLFVPAGAHASPAERRAAYFHQIEKLAGDSWRILIQTPHPNHYQDFHRPDLPIALKTGMKAIDNNYQKEQYSRKAIGLYSQETIYQANTLSLSLIYPYKPKVPGMAFLLRQLASFQAEPYAAQLMSRAGVLPIRYSQSMTMQSHPVLWEQHSNKYVNYPHLLNHSSQTRELTGAEAACRGIWCLSRANARSEAPASSPTDRLPSTAKPPYKEAPTNTHPPAHQVPTGTSSQPATQNEAKLGSTDAHNSGNQLPIEDEPTQASKGFQESAPSSQDEALCGVSLCCM